MDVIGLDLRYLFAEVDHLKRTFVALQAATGHAQNA